MREHDTRSILDRAAARLAVDSRVAVPLADLAGALGPTPVDPAWLERRLRDDPRFLVLHDARDLPGLDAWSASDRAAYAAVLRHAGPGATVLLAPRPDGPDGADGADGARRVLDDLLRRTLAELAELADATGVTGAAALARAAERVRLALGSDQPGPLSRGPAGAAPSTSPPPGPPTPRPAPRPRRRPGRPRPRTPGSRPG